MNVLIHRRILGLTAIVALAFPAAGYADHGEGAMMMKKHDAMKKIGLDGYCPVCILDARKWEKGSPNIASTYDGVTYYFPAEAIKAKFDASPEKYIPSLGGDCIVCYEKLGKRVAGNVNHAAIHRNRLYLFPGEKEKQAFTSNPGAFENSDLAVDGECIVCLAKFGKHVPGKPQHTVTHHGLRYQFPSENEANAFRQAPDQYAAAGQMKPNLVSKPMMEDNAMAKRPAAVRLVGRSGCAACEFGVTPLTNPDELGLAVVTGDGRVTVVEGAHENYPQIYAKRFESQQLAVEGMIVKTDGNVSWLKPSSVSVVN